MSEGALGMDEGFQGMGKPSLHFLPKDRDFGHHHFLVNQAKGSEGKRNYDIDFTPYFKSKGNIYNI